MCEPGAETKRSLPPMKLFVPPPRANRAPKSLASGRADSLGHGMDVALSVAIFIVLGWLLDRWLGTAPVFTIALIVVAAVGQFIRLKYTYDAEMERLEAERRAARTTRSPGARVAAHADETSSDAGTPAARASTGVAVRGDEMGQVA